MFVAIDEEIPQLNQLMESLIEKKPTQVQEVCQILLQKSCAQADHCKPSIKKEKWPHFG